MDVTEHLSLTLQTPVGACRLIWSDAGLARVRLLAAQAVEADETKICRPDGLKAVAAMLESYFGGASVDFGAVALDWRGVSAPDADIYAALRKVGHGHTTTYGALAAAAGRPGAARAVGSAMARNPWPIVVPCHRVLAAQDRPGGFSAPGGVATKRRLLALEGVCLDAGMPLLPGLLDGC